MEDKNPLWLPDQKIYNHFKRNKPYYDDFTDQEILLDRAVNFFRIEAQNLILGGQGHRLIDDKSTHSTFNFYNCNIGLQSNLNELAQLLSENGAKNEAKELENSAKALEQVEQSNDKTEVTKKGVANRLKRLADELSNEKSTLHKAVKGVKNGVKIAQDIGKGYNSIAQWLGLQQAPKLFLR